MSPTGMLTSEAETVRNERPPPQKRLVIYCSYASSNASPSD